MKFRKKPVVVEAWRIPLPGANPDCPIWLVEALLNRRVEMVPTGGAVIHTDTRDAIGGVGDWIIKGVKGELYPCKAEVFDAAYETVL